MVCHFLLQRIFPTLGLNVGLLYCRQILYRLSYLLNVRHLICLISLKLHNTPCLLQMRIPRLGSLFFFFLFSWRLITLQYCSGFCHTLKRISHGFTCVPHSDPPSPLPLHPIPLGLPSAPGPSACLMHPTWTGDLFHP